MNDVFLHESSYLDEGADVGAGTRIWHFSHVCSGAELGEGCNLGQNVFIGSGVKIGHRVKIQNNVSVYTGVDIEDDVFLGPSCVLTNISNPRSQVKRQALYEKTLLKRGCSIGANATIVCGVVVGRYALIGAGAVVTHDVPDYALMLGTPARQAGWVSRHGHRLSAGSGDLWTCPETGFRYEAGTDGVFRCLDLDEETPLAPEWSEGKKPYNAFKST